MSYLIANLQNDVMSINIDGFILKKGHGAFVWKKKTKEADLEITVPIYRGFDSFECQGVLAKVTFPELEKSIKKTIASIDGETEESFGLTSVCSRIEGVNTALFELKIRDSVTFQQVKPELEKAITVGALPFFERFSSPEKTADILAQASESEVARLLPGGSLFLSTILILRTAGHAMYEERRDQYYSKLKEKVEEFPRMKRILLAFESLFLS